MERYARGDEVDINTNKEKDYHGIGTLQTMRKHVVISISRSTGYIE